MVPALRSIPKRGLFDEAETVYAQSTEADNVTVIAPASSSTQTSNSPVTKQGKRQAIAPELEQVDRVMGQLPNSVNTLACGCTMAEIGAYVSEQLDIIPMQVRVLRHIRKRYGCCHAQHAPIRAKLPAQPLLKSNASAGFLSMLLMLKNANGMPLYRIVKDGSYHYHTFFIP